MRVALAYPFDGHAPDDVIDVVGAVGRRLIADGRARPVVDEVPLTPHESNDEKEPSDG